MSKKSKFSNNPQTHQRMEEWQRRQWIFGEVQAAGVLTPEALKRREVELEHEGAGVAQALLDDNQRGELTKFGAQRLASAANDVDTTTVEGDKVISRSYQATGNRVHSLQVTGIRRKEIDTEQLAMVYWLQAKRLVKDRRDKEAARLEREQVKMEFEAKSSQPTPEQPDPPKPSSKEVAKLKQQLEETREQLRQLGINPDDGSPQQPASELAELPVSRPTL
jgi:hypothetical protein